MKCYIYFIVNKTNGQRYVGQTTNFSRRKNEHFSALQNNSHPNNKLQSAYNKYGEESFQITKITYEDITKKELDEQEIYYIKKYNSFHNGYNLTEGGTGGDLRSKLDFDQFCFAYFGNKKYDGMTNKTGKYLKVDSSCIAAIKREESYDKFRERALALSEEEKNNWLKKFEDYFNLKEEKPWTVQKTPEDELTFQIMCIVSTYKRGIEGAVLKKLGLSKGFVFHLMTGKGRQHIIKRYKETSKEKIQEIGRKYFTEWDLQQYTKIKLKEEFTDLTIKYNRGCEPKSS